MKHLQSSEDSIDEQRISSLNAALWFQDTWCHNIHLPTYYVKMKKLPLTWGPIRPLIPGNPGSPFLPYVFNRKANIRHQGKNCYWDFPKTFTPKPVNLHYTGIQNISARNEGSTHHLDVQLQWSVWFLPPKYVHQEAEWHAILARVTSGNKCLSKAVGNSNSLSCEFGSTKPHRWGVTITPINEGLFLASLDF